MRILRSQMATANGANLMEPVAVTEQKLATPHPPTLFP
jgi:hypothetical protein